jgi:hypothetical protein
VAVAAALSVLVVSQTIRAQDVWYRSYQDGVEAFNRADYAVAESKLTAALNAKDSPKTRGRSVLYYSQIRREFLPEYYLALIKFRQGQFQDALRFAHLAESYIKTGDKEFATLAAAKTGAEKALTPTVAKADPPVVSPPPTPPVTQPPAGRVEYDNLIRDARNHAAAQRWDEARTAASRAKALGVDDRQAEDVLRAIDVQALARQLSAQLNARAWSNATPLVERLSSLEPSNPLVASAREAIASGLAVEEASRLERAGISAFYRGNYEQAVTTLQQVRVEVAPAVSRDRVTFYIACSNAALALLEGNKGKVRLERAQQLFRPLRAKQDLFAIDRKYISPEIIRALQGSS